jgi:hypothetical protein
MKLYLLIYFSSSATDPQLHLHHTSKSSDRQFMMTTHRHTSVSDIARLETDQSLELRSFAFYIYNSTWKSVRGFHISLGQFGWTWNGHAWIGTWLQQRQLPLLLTVFHLSCFFGFTECILNNFGIGRKSSTFDNKRNDLHILFDREPWSLQVIILRTFADYYPNHGGDLCQLNLATARGLELAPTQRISVFVFIATTE